MAIRSFSVGPQKGLVLAELAHVPDLMVVVGPNGAGKSTLLYELQRRKTELAEPNTQVLYLNPNRPWRRTTFGSSFLFNLQSSFRQMTEAASFPGFTNYNPPGFVSTGLPRSPDNVDDIQGLVKFSIVKLETRRQRYLAEEFDRRDGELPRGAIADTFAPLRELVEELLPHLRFDGVDMSNETLLQVFFRKLDGNEPVRVEMDDLSSGEKAVIQLFLPFIEDQIDRLLTVQQGSNGAQGLPRTVALIDEPEIHLHPALQVALIAYMRQLAASGAAQFIIATHSTTIMDSVEDDELYLLAPPVTVGDHGNQLMRLTATAERLDAVREITGSTYVVTRCRPIVFLEGDLAAGSRKVTDQRLVETLVPESRGWVLVPCRSKAEAIKGASDLLEPSLTHLPGMSVFALVDRDRDDDHREHVVPWTVCMIENLLLDPVALWEALEPTKEAVGLASTVDIDAVLKTYIAERRDREIELRVRWRLPQLAIHHQIASADQFDTLENEVAKDLKTFIERFDDGSLVESTIELATTEVDEIISDGKGLDLFHGKEILKRFFEEYAKHSGMSYSAFCYVVARTVREHDRLRMLLEKPIRRIRQFVPLELVLATEAAIASLSPDSAPAFQTVLQTLRASRKKWEDYEEDSTDRSALRQELSKLARHLKLEGHATESDRLLSVCVSLGTG